MRAIDLFPRCPISFCVALVHPDAMALSAGKAPIKEICYQLGFKQASHFAAWFRRHSGSYPQAFRAAGQQRSS
jgi:AraC-like DNA-binding protein